MSFPVKVALAGTVCCALSACGDPEAGASTAPAMRDSDGVAIVDNLVPLWKDGQPWRVSAEPALQIGKVQGQEAYLFDRVTDATRLSDGRIVVADQGYRRIRYYGAAGRYLGHAGGPGGGPGEFRGLQAIHSLTGDSVAAWDMFLGE